MALPYEGALRSLLPQLKYGGRWDLGEALGPFLTAQFVHLGWDRPDCIVPVPSSAAHYMRRGYSQVELLAGHLARELDIPLIALLQRQSGDWSQAGLSRKERLELSSERLFVNESRLEPGITRILLLDDVMSTGRTLYCCAARLKEEIPCQVYGLALCGNL
jgi:ComF family protein